MDAYYDIQITPGLLPFEFDPRTAPRNDFDTPKTPLSDFAFLVHLILKGILEWYFLWLFLTKFKGEQIINNRYEKIFRRANSGEKTLSPPSLRVEKRCWKISL